jgi:hypothetical protein
VDNEELRHVDSSQNIIVTMRNVKYVARKENIRNEENLQNLGQKTYTPRDIHRIIHVY